MTLYLCIFRMHFRTDISSYFVGLLLWIVTFAAMLQIGSINDIILMYFLPPPQWEPISIYLYFIKRVSLLYTKAPTLCNGVMRSFDYHCSCCNFIGIVDKNINIESPNSWFWGEGEWLRRKLSCRARRWTRWDKAVRIAMGVTVGIITT